MRIVTVEKLESILSRTGDNPRIIASGNFATPKTLLQAVDSVFPTYRLNMLNAQPGIPNRGGHYLRNCLCWPRDAPPRTTRVHPGPLELGTKTIRDHYTPDVVLLHTSSQRFDTVSLGTEVNILPAAIEAVRERGGLVIAQANTQMPYTYGDAQVYHDDIDFLVEVDEPLDVHEPIAPSPVSQAVGEVIAARVDDGSTMQLGIGEVPNAVVSRLADRKGLRIWTEMFSDGVLDLHKNDALDPDRPLTASFLFGSRELYDWVHMNTRIRMMRTEVTNNPGKIEK